MGCFKVFKSCFSSQDAEQPEVAEKHALAATPSYASSTASAKTTKSILEQVIAEVSTPLIQQALTVAAKQTYRLDNAFPVPEIQSSDEILIRNYAVGLNPIDWKSVDWNFCLPSFPWVTGREMSGVVEQVGDDVTEFKKGDRVWTSTYYRDIRSGCFQEFVIAPKHTVKPIPHNISFEAAACLGVCGLTGAMTLWKWLDMPIVKSEQPLRKSERDFLLVWGGSSITGQFIIQIAAHSGLEVISVSSEKTKDLLYSLGAKHIIIRDGKLNEDIVAEIRAIGGDNIVKGIDLVGPETAVHCMAALSSSSAVKFAPLSFLPKGTIAPAHVSVQDVEMKWFVLEKSSEKYAVAFNWLLEKGVIKTPQLEVLDGGLAVVEKGLGMQKRGDKGGMKLIVSLRK